MRKNGWQLPYHPLQVVAIAVFLALGFAFYVFFAPFVGKKVYQYIAMGLYTPLITCVFGLYIWCAAADPADSGVFKSKKYLKIPDSKKLGGLKDSKLGADSTSSMHDGNASTVGPKSVDKEALGTEASFKDVAISIEKKSASSPLLLVCSPCAYICSCSSSSEESSDKQTSEDGMFYCSLCEVEVFKYSKHCRVCDKCVDRFDHHCRWLNNCIGKKNYRQFFTLMVAALLLLILQWLTGILVLICCFIKRKQFSVDVSSKLGSSFTLAPFVIVVAVCTILAMLATLPLAQLFFFHILLIKKFDVVPPETASVSSLGKKSIREEPVKKKNPAAVKISPWALARLNAEEVSKAAAEARKKSKILQPVVRQNEPFRLEADHNSGSSGRRMAPRIDNRRRPGKRARMPADLPTEALTRFSASNMNKGFSGTSSLASLQLETQGGFQTSQAVSSSAGIVASSPESSLDSPDIHPFRVSSTVAEEARRLGGLSAAAGAATLKEFPLSRSTSDGYEASGGEDSDQVPTRIVQRSTNWSNLLFSADQDDRTYEPNSSSSLAQHRKW
ncbi:probable protein S-acyltransferase 22 isoform X3 [Lotus japonicus]|uniref:probable protein S-acyltransferase 22 isoform X3 n=1 Tax=Lotus japonicus TaxID=34305 RepID=UPI00258E6578|nr:probable protein S-acyltransferase 22 isoform X3 [Lotus japonicus]